jgi:hypothetical protein
MAKDQRDVLAELDGINSYLMTRIGPNPTPGWGQDANLKRLAGEYAAFRACAQNIVELADIYDAGVTHGDRLRSAGMLPGSGDSARVAELERQLAEARAASNG